MYPLTTPVAIATIQKLPNYALQPMESSKRYNSVPVRDNCALFAPTPIFLGPGYSMVSLKFVPWRPLLATNRSYLKTKLAAADNVTSHIIFSLHQLPLLARRKRDSRCAKVMGRNTDPGDLCAPVEKCLWADISAVFTNVIKQTSERHQRRHQHYLCCNQQLHLLFH